MELRWNEMKVVRCDEMEPAIGFEFEAGLSLNAKKEAKKE